MDYPLTNPQNSIWLTEKFYTNTAINNIGGYVYIKEPVDFDTLKKAINIAIKTNDGMRLNFKEENNLCVQFVSGYSELEIETIELKSKQEAKKKAKEISTISFVLMKNNLFKFILYKLPDNSGGFILNGHHIIGDSWSFGLIVKKITNIYSNILNNIYDEEKMPSYLDYIKSENEYLNSNKFLKDKEYWNNVFSSVPEVASIPAYNSNLQNEIAYCGNRLNFIFSENDINKIKEFCSKYNVSIYNFFMAVYSIYIGKVSNLDDFIIGTPVLNRTTYSQKNTIGMFVSTCPLRINLDHELYFSDFVKNISLNTLSVFRHQKYPYQSILEDLRKKDSSIPNLYNIILSYQITKTIEETSNLNYSTEWVHNGYCADELQIHLFDLNNENSINVAYDYKTNKYTEKDISDLHSRISTIIAQIVENPELKLKEIEIVTPEEKNKILYEFNDTYANYPMNKTVIDLFEEQAEKNPDKIAVVFEDKQLTYRELNEKSNQLARYLIENRIKKGDTISIVLNKNINFIISVIATQKVGAIYTPIYSKYPFDRINYITKYSKSKLLITDTHLYNNKINFSNILFIDKINTSDKCNKNINIINSPEDILYNIFTSGSTGNPKGIQITNKNLVNFLYNFVELFNNPINETFLSSTSISFDVSIFEIFLPICFGNKLVFNKYDVITNIFDFCQQIIDYQISSLYIPPNILNEVFDILYDNNYEGINNLLVGVESIESYTLNKYYKLNENITIVNGYGPSETTICATSLKYTKDLSPNHIVSIGKPLKNNQIYILSKDLSLLPPNTPGEIYVSGNGVSLGYINNIEKNKKSFISNPFTKSSIMYSTGDIALWNNDGTIKFIGRKDNQIKLHGYRIELDEINSIIGRYPDIIKSCSQVINNKIIAYYLAEQHIKTNNLKEFISQYLPFYMIPTHIIALETLPLTINGKIDYKKLPTKDTIEDTANYIAPTTKKEIILCSIFEKIFKKDKIGINDNFFELGGDSLLAIQLQNEALKYQLNITYGDIFNNPTISLLSKIEDQTDCCLLDKNYDYEKLNELLQINKIDNIPIQLVDAKYNDFLLLGVTGYLGIHILITLLEKTDKSIYCLIRKKGNLSLKDRFLKILHFYFGNKYDLYLDKRIFLIEGDITQKNIGINDNSLQLIEKNVSHIINSAALVKHYDDINKFININVTGTNNIVEFCKKLNIQLCHVSTISVSGTHKTPDVTSNYFSENNFYINQTFNNSYLYTKFKSEQIILEEIKNGLKAKIFRLGNIANRYYDGKFQMNFADNAYMHRLKTFTDIKNIPDNLKEHYVDFSPVDYCASAIVKLIQCDINFTIFHIFNNNLISIIELIKYLNKLNYNINFVDNQKFKTIIQDHLNDPKNAHKLSGIIPDLTPELELKLIYDILPQCEFTTYLLKQIGFEWPEIDYNYIKKLIFYFKELNYFN